MRPKMHVRSNDTVEIISGVDRGKQGRVLKVMPEERRVVVEGRNMVWKHERRNRQQQQGPSGRIQIEAPIHASNVLPVCQNRDCDRFGRGVRVKRERNEDGTGRRVCAKCGHVIETPEQA